MIREHINNIVGHVKAYLEDAQGNRVLVQEVHNDIMYAASDALASLYGGRNGAPSKIGFVTDATPLSGRDVELKDFTNKQVNDFSFAPDLSKSGSNYKNNVVTFHGRSNYGTSSATVTAAILLDTNDNVLSYVKFTTSVAKPEGLELALDWSITFLSEAETPSN